MWEDCDWGYIEGESLESAVKNFLIFGVAKFIKQFPRHFGEALFNSFRAEKESRVASLIPKPSLSRSLASVIL